MFGGSFLEKQEVSDDLDSSQRRSTERRCKMEKEAGDEKVFRNRKQTGPEEREIKGLKCCLV